MAKKSKDAAEAANKIRKTKSSPIFSFFLRSHSFMTVSLKFTCQSFTMLIYASYGKFWPTH